MTLKDLIAKDVEDVFFALDDFAETHRIEGKEVDIVIDVDRFVLFEHRSDLPGIGPQDLVIFARTADLKGIPRRVVGSLLNIDGKDLVVQKWTENMGVSEIQLTQNRSI